MQKLKYLIFFLIIVGANAITANLLNDKIDGVSRNVNSFVRSEVTDLTRSFNSLSQDVTDAGAYLQTLRSAHNENVLLTNDSINRTLSLIEVNIAQLEAHAGALQSLSDEITLLGNEDEVLSVMINVNRENIESNTATVLYNQAEVDTLLRELEQVLNELRR
jgi:uncharacterized protein YukE